MYLKDAQIHEMANAAFRSYEMTGDWFAATNAAYEYAVDEIGVCPNYTAVLLARKIAKTRWMAVSQRVRREVAA